MERHSTAADIKHVEMGRPIDEADLERDGDGDGDGDGNVRGLLCNFFYRSISFLYNEVKSTE